MNSKIITLGIKKTITLIFSVFFLFSCSNPEIEKEVKTEGKQKYIIALGDSITAGYRLELEDSYPFQLEKILKQNNYNYKLINAGVSGDTSKELLNRVDLYLNDEQKLPQIAILVIGGNDGLRSGSIEEMSENIKKVIKKLKAKNIKVV